MKILYIASWYPRPRSQNSGIFFRQLAEGIADDKNEVVVACVHTKFIGKIDKIGLDIRKREKIAEYMWFVPMLFPRFKAFYNVVGKYYMNRLLKKLNKIYGGFDIIHIQSAFSAAVYALPYLKKNNTPIIYTEHSSALLRDKISKQQKNALNELTTIASANVAVSSVLAKKLSCYTDNVKVIGNMLDLEPIAHVPQEKFTFLCMGTLRKDKGMDALIKAFVKAFSPEEEVRLIIAGDGEYKNELNSILEEVNKYDIKLIGPVAHDNVAEFYSQGDCFVLPSLYETFGIVYIEAMSCGLPVIATRCGGPEEFVNKENGILIDIKNENQLVLALREMYNNQSFNSEKISNNIMNTYGKRQICELYKALYESVV